MYFKPIILVLLVLPSVLYAGNDYSLPDFGDSAGAIISPEHDRRLGQLFLNQVRKSTRINSIPEVEYYIQSLGHRLAAHTDRPEQPFQFFVIDNTDINAFAGPGGVIGINSGVIINSRNESELASVIAHEISHVTQRHLARRFERAKQFSLAQTAALIGAVILATQSSQAGAGAITGLAGLNVQDQLNFSQANEKEADRLGLRLLADAGYDPHALPGFFEQLQKKSRYRQTALPEYLRSHPLTTSRIADSRARAARYPSRHYQSSHFYNLVKYKLIVDAAKSVKDAITLLKNQLKQHQPASQDVQAIRYGLAHAYIKNSDFQLAEAHVNYLLEQASDNVLYLLLAARLATAQADYDAAFVIYDNAYQNHPNYRPVVIAYSRALLDVNRGQRARDILTEYGRRQAHDLLSYSLLGQAEAMLGNEVETAMLQTEYYYLAGETKLAVDKLKFIQQRYQLDYYREQRVLARLAELEYELELEKKFKL